jgi:photosystem II stability/assembly factor-like uncharacterized protein/predicted esterase
MGTFHSQSIAVGSETRFYFLHVPSAYDCSTPTPLLVDFHGTGFGNIGDPVEESWDTDELTTVSDEQSFMVVRPRSRSKPFNGGNLFQWDINDGDLDLNHAFVEQLVGLLGRQYNIDSARTYASGFSNGPNMAVRFVGETLFRGFGLMAGGLFPGEPFAPALRFDAASAPRVYATTGFRDYLFPYLQSTKSFLTALNYPEDHWWHRRSDAGHELYGWQFREMWGWIDGGTKPPAGALASQWVQESFPEHDDLTQLARSPTGDLVATGAGGRLWWRDAKSGAWSPANSVLNDFLNYPNPFAGVCLSPSGTGMAVGGTLTASTSDGGRSWTKSAPVPDFNTGLGYGAINSIACHGSLMIAGGYWLIASSSDSGHSWKALQVTPGGNVTAGVRVSDAGTWLAVGYPGLIARSTDGAIFSKVTVLGRYDWFYDAASPAPGRWCAVGERGAIVCSADDGQTWAARQLGRSDDLYAIAFADASRGLVVGEHGAALFTGDGGTTWRDVSPRLDVMLSSVQWLDAATALVVGESGLVLTVRP